MALTGVEVGLIWAIAGVCFVVVLWSVVEFVVWLSQVRKAHRANRRVNALVWAQQVLRQDRKNRRKK